MKLCGLVFALSATTVASAHNPIADSVQLVASIGTRGANDRPIHARKGEVVTLYVVARIGGTYFSDAPSVMLAGKRVATKPLAQAPKLDLAWYRIEPTHANISNTASGGFRFERIDYRATAIEHARAGSLVADVRPTLTPDHGGGVGTMRYQIVAKIGNRTLASPGVKARRGRGSGGLTDAVLRVSIRRDDSYLGFLTEMYGQPYVWASAGVSDKSHQSERLEGSDCADFVVYGARRMGKRVPYTWTGALASVTSLLAAGTRGDDGVYRDRAGKPLPYTRAGDIVLFPRHVGVLAVDKGEKGVLDDKDLMMHTLFDSPKEQPIADSGYAHKPVELRRWR